MENIFVEFLPPWVETGIQPAFYDKESGTVLQQTARMYARVNMLIRMFNKLSKNTKATVEDYINQFNELHDYVHDYFDNLDVQEEINNKLDAMAEAGTLQEIITTYIQANVAWCFDTVADMKLATNLVDGSYAQTLGFHTINDGGGALYKITSTGTANEMNVIAVGDLFANLITNNIKNLKQFGCYGNGTNDDTTIIKTVLQNLANGDVVYLPKGTYLCETDVNVTVNDIRIYGDGQLNSTIDFNNNGSIVFNGHGVKLNNIRFTKQDKIEFDSYHNTLNNVNIDHGNLGLLLKNAYITECHNCYFTYNTVGLVCDNQAYEVVITDSIIDNNKLGVLILGTTGVKLDNCTIEGNRDTSTNKGCGVAFSCSNADIIINDCWFESNGTSNDSADILSVADVYDSIFEDIYTTIHSYYAFNTYNSAGKIVITNNHHNFTQYGVVMGGYLGHYTVSNNYYKGLIDKYNKPILVMSRSNDLTYNYLKAHNNLVMNTDNTTINTQMLSGIKGSYIYTNAVITTANKPKLITTEYYELDGEPLFVYMPFIKNLSSVKYLKQWQSGGTSYNIGSLYGNTANTYTTTSPTVYLTLDGTGSTRNIFTATGDTTYAFIQASNSKSVVRKDSNTPQVSTPLAEGFMEIRTDNLYNQEAQSFVANTAIFALVEFNADEKKASKQCIAMQPKDYYPTLLPPTL